MTSGICLVINIHDFCLTVLDSGVHWFGLVYCLSASSAFAQAHAMRAVIPLHTGCGLHFGLVEAMLIIGSRLLFW